MGSIATVRADGSDLRTIVEPGRDANAPAFSRDGHWLYFQSNASGTYAIYRCKPDGTEVRVDPHPGDRGPDLEERLWDLRRPGTGGWSSWCMTARPATWRLPRRDGSQAQGDRPEGRISVHGGPGPDRRHDRLLGTGGGLPVAADPAGGRAESPVVLTPDHPESFCPQFTPDGKTLVFFRRDGDIYRVGHRRERPAEAHRRRPARRVPALGPGSPRLQRSPRHLARRPADRLHRRAGRRAERPRHEPRRERATSGHRSQSRHVAASGWSPDGRQLAFVSFEGKYPQLFVVPADRGMPRQMTHVDGAVYFLRWQPLKEEK